MTSTPTTLASGTLLGRYEILAPAGAGGMGEVYRARDTRLHRIVAVKVLPQALLGDPERRERLEAEARAISRLTHPHICTLYDVGHQDTDRGPVDFLVMEFLEGESLAAKLSKGPIPLDECLRHAIGIAGALDTAHRRGIVHRDLKPGNIMLTQAGAKLVDFGLARLTGAPPSEAEPSAAPTVTKGPKTRPGAVLGTPAYMSPEQAQGRPSDARSDIFSFGVVLHEMLTRQRAFPGDSSLQILAGILRDDPPPARTLRPEVGEDLQQVLDRCLAKDPAGRYPDASSLATDLEACMRRQAGPPARPPWRGPLSLVVAATVLAVVAVSVWTAWRSASELRVRRDVLPEMARLVEANQVIAAFRVAQDSLDLLRGDPEFDRLWLDISLPVSMRTEPDGAEIFYKDYDDPDADWNRLGTSPLEDLPAPFGLVRWKVVKDGFEPVMLALPGTQLPGLLTLVPRGEALPGMVRVPGGQVAYRAAQAPTLGDYWLDRYEVTNREFKEFVDQGGYLDPAYWPEPFIKKGRELSFEEAMDQFRDTTGRPGPSTWELGSYPEGHEDYPVSGVSWYEARAYAEFAGKSLPTFHHWFHAAGAEEIFSGILRLSNFGGTGPAPVGRHQGLSPWGAYDMAGNVREWVWNASGDRRYTLGGAWSDPTYLFTGPDALDPFDRDPILGFRCARYLEPPPEAAFGPIETVFRDYSKEEPVSDDVFAAYRDLHRYDPGPLEARVESSSDDTEYWREEHISYSAAYDGERIPAILYLPRNATPPYQAILYFPPGSANFLYSLREAGTRPFAFLVRSGRAVLFPGYKGTFERRLPSGAGDRARRDTRIQWSKDLGRSIDYLASRPDIDARRIAFYGVSMGAVYGPIAGAVDPRFRALVFVGGGLGSQTPPPEVDPFNFAPRVHAPVLMINGDHDFLYPVEESQLPLFRLLAAPEGHKRHYVFDGGHVPPRWQEVARETLDWLDKELGPISETAAPDGSVSVGKNEK